MTATAQQFIQFAIENQALSFGEFTLKSKRVSPYFFNSGCFKTGKQIAQLGEFYAQAIVESGVAFDVMFGPAYKGIPLVCAVAIALAAHHGIDKPLCFNRKEAKSYGEGGDIVGAEMTGRVLIIDDVLTAGTAFRQSADIIRRHHAELAGFVLLFDRQEKGQGSGSAVQEVAQEFNIPVMAIASLSDLLAVNLSEIKVPHAKIDIAAIKKYQQQYGISQ